MATPTYDLIDSVTLSSSAASVTFSSISGYRDLVLVSQALPSGSESNFYARYNGDSGSSQYHYVFMSGNGSTASSSSANGPQMPFGRCESGAMSVNQIMDYSATDKHKTHFERRNSTTDRAWAFAGRWNSTAAITSILLAPYSGDFASGSTFYLYGIAG